eukprot:m.288599 g.288599  ORF g.288599 m.288599 type:complete len:167 (+) comp16220_c0_seq61:55-555(+)
MASEDNLDHYAVLGLLQTCTAEELRERFKVLSLQLHPDKQHPSAATSAGNPVAGDAEATSFQRVVQAYSTLKDSVARKHYDAVRLAGGVAQELPVDAEVDLDDLTWDDETGRYTWPCRCSSEFVATEEHLEAGLTVFGCSGCTLSIRIHYEAAEDDDGEAAQVPLS